MDLNGQVSVVTGGSRGIGRGIALALAKAGTDLVINYRKDEKATEEVVVEIKGMGRKAIPFPVWMLIPGLTNLRTASERSITLFLVGPSGCAILS